jgi:hypothetical protein
MNQFHFFLSVAATMALAAGSARAQSTIDAAEKYAYGANTGWINFRPSAVDGVITGESILSGYAYAANTGWIHMGDGTPANGHTYANAAATDYGVNHDGGGNLSGFAYSANTGWINLGWAGPNDPNRPRFDLITGNFSGYAWSANTGWINLGSGFLNADQILCLDTDIDGIGDAWEMQRFGNLTAAAIGTDADKDGQSDAAEFVADTNPNDPWEFLSFVSHEYAPDFAKVTLQFATTRPTRLYRIQGSTTLQSTGPGAWADVGGLGAFAADPGAMTEKTIDLPGATTRQFLRVVPVKPLQP